MAQQDNLTMRLLHVQCLDRHCCYALDPKTHACRRLHPMDECPLLHDNANLQVHYRLENGTMQQLSIAETEALMNCSYTPRLCFQNSSLLMNYGFWGFNESTEGFDTLPERLQQMEPNELLDKVFVGHVKPLGDAECSETQPQQTVTHDEDDHHEHQELHQDNALGLFARQDLSAEEFLGEYTGVLKTDHHHHHDHAFDAYGLSYPCTYEKGDLHVSAKRLGNVIRCINHSFSSPNARFVPMVHDGMLHIFCFTITSVKKGNQILVNYGKNYWKSAGIEPLEF